MATARNYRQAVLIAVGLVAVGAALFPVISRNYAHQRIGGPSTTTPPAPEDASDPAIATSGGASSRLQASGDQRSLGLVSGIVHLYDWQGEPVQVPQGYILLHQGSDTPTPVWLSKGGVWSAPLEAGALTVDELQLNGVMATMRQTEFEASPENTIVIEADLAQGLGLRILDAVTGDELSGVWVVPARSFEDLLSTVPPTDAISGSLARDADSPVELPHRSGAWAYWVGAPPWHSWRTITADGGEPGSLRTVALERGGCIVIRPIGGRAETLTAAIRPVGSTLDYGSVTCKVGDEARIEGVLPGGYYCILRRRDGATVAEIEARVNAEADVVVEMSVPKDIHELNGRLSWPIANDFIQPELSLYRKRLGGAMERVAERPREWRRQGGDYYWSFGDRVAGEYVIAIEPTQQIYSATHGRQSSQALDGGHVIQGEGAAFVFVHPPPTAPFPAREFGMQWSRIEGLWPDAVRTEQGTYSFSCAPGTVRVSWGGAGCNCLKAQEYEVSEGPNDVIADFENRVSEAMPTLEVEVSFHESGVPVPVDIDPWRVVQIARAMSGSGKYLGARGGMISGLTARFPRIHLLFDQPGVYLFDPPDIDGYRPVGTLRVEVPSQGPLNLELVPLP